MTRLLTALLVLALAAPLSAQLGTFPFPDFAPGQVIASGEVNANFGHVADNALNRTGGTIEGHITLDTNITIDSADISDYLIATGHVHAGVTGDATTPAFALSTETNTGTFFATGALAWSLAGTERGRLDGSGLTIRGTNIFNSSGKVPAISSTYLANLDAQDLQLAEASFTDGTALARLAADETISAVYTHAKGTITASKPLGFSATWNDAATTFTGINLAITNTASAAASKLWNVAVGGSAKIHTTVGGNTVISALQITGGAAANYFLVGDANGTGYWQPSADAVPVPTGMLAFFEAACPTGWTIRSDASNTYNAKMIRGGATFSGTGGGADTHTHSVDPPSTESGTESGDHTHDLNLAAFAGTSGGSHTHSISGSTGTSGGSHTHTFSTGSPSETITANIAGATAVATDSHTHSGTTGATNIDHTHGAGSLSAAANAAHAHDWDFPNTTSGGKSTTHTHALDIASFTSGAGDSIPAYVQVIICRKD